jgi:UDP-N-acetylmuramoyl-tripeptide--D-alanyl-D-alanine ligase
MQLTLREVAEALKTQEVSVLLEPVDMNIVASGYSIDTRTLNPGDLFFAIRGPHFDGHDFVETALKQGACGAVVAADWMAQRSPRGVNSTPLTARNLIVVEDTVAALQTLAARARRWWGGRVIAITGSAGKTTTKEICAALLSSTHQVFKSEGNLNNLLGVPLSLLRVDTGSEIGVIELAMSAREEIRQLTRIASPDVGVVTNVNPVHLQFFSSLEEIALDKREMVEELPELAVAVLNADDALVAGFRSHTSARVLTYGESEGADIQIRNIWTSDLKGSSFDLYLPSFGRLSLQLPLLGQHNVWNAAAAVTAARCFGVPAEAIAHQMERLQPAPMRGQLLRFAEGFTVIDDTYNSNPRALHEMISVMGSLNGFRRKIVVAGEMLELGEKSRSFHFECGKAIAGAGVDVLLAVRGDAEAMAAGARKAGMSCDKVLFFSTAAEAGKTLSTLVQSGDLVLMKGSRDVKMEVALDCLRQKFSTEGP